MSIDQLTPDQFRYVLHACKRVLINRLTLPVELKSFLYFRLVEDHGDVAGVLAGFDEMRMQQLRQNILTALEDKRSLVLLE